jgi:hypothetical protein
MRQRKLKDIFSKQGMDVEDMLMSMVTGIELSGESEIVAIGGRKEYKLKDDPSLESDGTVPSHEVSDRDIFKLVFEQFRDICGKVLHLTLFYIRYGTSKFAGQFCYS